MRHLPLPVRIRAGIALLTVLAGVAACGPASPSAPAATTGEAAGAGTTSVSTAASGTSGGSGASGGSGTSSDDPDAGLRTGPQLAALLPAPAELPRGFRVTADGPQDSGAEFGTDPVSAAPAHPDCGRLEGGNAWVTALGRPAAFAQTEFRDGSGSQILAEVDAYRGAQARSVMAGYRRLFAACRTFTYTEGSTHARVSLGAQPGPAAGDESLRAVLRTPSFEGGVTVVVVRVGQLVTTVYDNSTAKDLGAAAVGLATATARRCSA